MLSSLSSHPMTSEQIPVETTLGILKQLEIFRSVPPEVLEKMAMGISVNKFQPEERIITQGDIGNSMYIIISGHVKVHDKEFVVAEIEGGNFFGEFNKLNFE